MILVTLSLTTRLLNTRLQVDLLIWLSAGEVTEPPSRLSVADAAIRIPVWPEISSSLVLLVWNVNTVEAKPIEMHSCIIDSWYNNLVEVVC
jgi:hypothetical protein